jgi:hypothetical protein
MQTTSDSSLPKEGSITKRGKEKRKRGPSSKFPLDVLEFLESNQERYSKTPSNTQANDFWPSLFKDFWERFTLAELRGSSDVTVTVIADAQTDSINHDNANQVVSSAQM